MLASVQAFPLCLHARSIRKELGRIEISRTSLRNLTRQRSDSFNCFRVVLPCVVVTSPSLVLPVRYGRSTALLAFDTGPAKCLRRPYVLDNMGPSAAPQNTEPRRKRMKHTRYFSRRGASELIYTPGQHYSHLNATH